MKKIKLVLSFLVIALTFSNCGTSVKVVDQWKTENFKELKSEKILVIHHTPNAVNVKRLELDLVKALEDIGIDADGMHEIFPEEKYIEDRTEEEIQEFTAKVKAAGYDGVIITMLRDKDQQIQTTSSGGYYGGGYYPSHYGGYYGGFGSYYGGVYGYGYGGSYIPPSSTTKVVDIYLLETVTYNLSLKAGEQLVGVVSVKVEDPQSYSGVAEKYIKIVVDQFKD
ncbi:MAG: hypothetical protein KAH07_06585 [Flavobacteriaceae bacterium]|nr:hypothetical protein [Flavobacteriaceae bacterium]